MNKAEQRFRVSHRFGDNLRYLREESNMTQVDLAKKAGIEQSMISEYESGLKAPNLVNIVRLAKQLECTMDELFDGTIDQLEPYEGKN